MHRDVMRLVRKHSCELSFILQPRQQTGMEVDLTISERKRQRGWVADQMNPVLNVFVQCRGHDAIRDTIDNFLQFGIVEPKPAPNEQFFGFFGVFDQVNMAARVQRRIAHLRRAERRIT